MKNPPRQKVWLLRNPGDTDGRWVSIASLDTAEAIDGAEVEILWGDADGGTTNPLVPAHTQTRIRATVSLNSPRK